MFVGYKRSFMYYIQELTSLVGDADLDKDEVEVLNRFTDERVGFRKASGYDYFHDKCFLRALRKIKEKGHYKRFQKLVIEHLADNKDEFSNQMDVEL